MSLCVNKRENTNELKHRVIHHVHVISYELMSGQNAADQKSL